MFCTFWLSCPAKNPFGPSFQSLQLIWLLANMANSMSIQIYNLFGKHVTNYWTTHGVCCRNVQEK